jgi:predicted site-specific integrase-resolvase
MGVSTRLIHYFRSVGKLKAVTSGKARFYFMKEDVEDFLKEKGYE